MNISFILRSKKITDLKEFVLVKRINKNSVCNINEKIRE